MPQAKRLLLIAGIVGLLVAWYFTLLPSDDTLIASFTNRHDDVAQIVAMLHEEREPFFVSASGWWEERQSIPLSDERIAVYRVLLQRIGATRVGGGGGSHDVLFQYFTPISPFGGPAKDVIYTQQPQSITTTESTDWYRFQPGQYQRVCRSIETDWYICKDYED